jgi:hypothetical protein
MVSENEDSVMIPEELKKMAKIATDMQIPAKMRDHAVEQIGSIGSHEALLVLLNMAANEHLNKELRDLAVRKARDIIKKSPQ